jgi:hypothetical protein
MEQLTTKKAAQDKKKMENSISIAEDEFRPVRTKKRNKRHELRHDELRNEMTAIRSSQT